MKKIRSLPFPILPVISLSFLMLSGILTGCRSVSNPDKAINRLLIDRGISNKQAEYIGSTLALYPNGTQLSIALVDSSGVIYYGAVREGDTLLTMANENGVFEIGSLSKVFTSAIMVDLAARNRLKIEQPIRNYLGISMHEGSRITFKQLSNHTSGLPRIPDGFIWESLWHLDNPYKDYDEGKLCDYLENEIELISEAGEMYRYSNIGAGILGYVLTVIEVKDYEQLFREVIAVPFGMNRSTTVRDSVSQYLVSGLTKRGSRAENWDLGALKGAGAILSTAKDLSRFIIANFDEENEVFNLQRKETFRIDREKGIALGWFILDQETGTSWHWHNGGTGGYRSSMVLDVEDRLGVVVLSNISAGHSHAANIDSLSFLLLEGLQISNSQPASE
ncbi:MAG: serine hydrolase domain-containing protein [Candidatus Halalkalibacterium sp. M3_1C_030]